MTEKDTVKCLACAGLGTLPVPTMGDADQRPQCPQCGGSGRQPILERLPAKPGKGH